MSTIGLNVWPKVKCGAKKLIVYANGECVANGFMCSESVGWKPDWSLGWKPVGHMAGSLTFFSKEQKNASRCLVSVLPVVIVRCCYDFHCRLAGGLAGAVPAVL